MVFSKKDIVFLTEDVDVGKVELSIKKRQPVKAYYEADDDPRGSGWRIIQPVAYGLSKAGNPVVRAYQPFGDTKTKVPHWKLFRLDRFTNWNNIRKQTNIPTPPLDEFNPNGDKTMSTVYLIADFAGAKARYERGGLQKYNANRGMEKIAQNPYYDLQKNIERSKNLGKSELIQKNIADWNKNKPDFMKNWMNSQSAEEMSNTTDFGDKNYTQTDNPISKDAETNVNSTNNQELASAQQNDYQNISKNGPILKGSVDTEDEKNKENKNKQDLNNKQI